MKPPGGRGHGGWISRVALALFVFASAPSAEAAEAHDASAAPLIDRARALGIAESLAWRRILHARPSAWGGTVSPIDAKSFFLSPRGASDPAAELEATLRAFELPFKAGDDAHALCRFPARRRLLDQRLHFEGDLHAPACPALAAYLEKMDPVAVAVVYSANYLNNPASAFGHTFLRITKRRGASATASQAQLDMGVDFVAETDTKNPLLYAFKGLTGMFPGVFELHSFETKIREYGNLEARDLWEYDLALTPQEIELLALHLWELSSTHIDYYYLTRNCSFEVIEVLEAAAPRLELVSRLKLVVLPKDAVRVLYEVPGLVRELRYRPSLRSRFRAQVARLGTPERDAVERLTEHPDAPLPARLSLAESVATLDTAVFVLDSRFAKQIELARDPKLLAARARLTQRRAELSTTLPPPPPAPAPLDKSPDRGPAGMRLLLGSGSTTQFDTGFATLGYRLALHDLADPPDGEPELSQVQFLDAQLRYDAGRRLLTLDTLTFAEVVALNPITRYERDVSWRARAFGVRLHDRGCTDCFAHGLDVALGGTLATPDEHVALWVMGDAYVAFSGSLDGIGGSFVRVGVGPYAGVRVRLPDETIALVTGTWSYLPAAHLHTTFDARASLRRPLAKDVALGIEAAVQPLSTEAQLDSYLYF